MARKLLFAVDFSPYTEKLLGCAGELGNAGINDVMLLYVLESKRPADYGDHPNPAHVKEMEEAREHLEKLSEALREEGLHVQLMLKAGQPAEVIAETAREEDADLIFLGAHGRGFLERAVLGSTSERVLNRADRPVMIQHCRVNKEEDGYSCENACTSLFGNILVASDFSKYGESVRPLLIDLAKTFCTPITLLHVQEGKYDMGYEVLDRAKKEKVRGKMEKLQDLSYELGDFCESVRIDIVNGDPPSAILAYAEDIDASLIVMGAFGEQGPDNTKLGRVTHKVVRKSERPIMVLKARTS
jgi:nucleotide-binding universal stress UspA family protein